RVDERARVLLRCLVDPLEILGQDHEWPPPAFPQGELTQQLGAPALDGLRAKGRDLLGSAPDAQQVPQVRGGLGRVETHLVERPVELLPDGLGAVGLRDPAALAQDVENRKIRNAAPVGKTPPLEEGQRAPALRLAKLVKKARLA